MSKKKCQFCKRRKLITQKCKCNKIFCLDHLVPNIHSCSYNYFLENKNTLKDKNPKIITNKLQKI